MAQHEPDWLDATWQRTSRALRRMTGRDAADERSRLAHLRQLYPAEVAALLDLGLSDGAVAAYLLDARDVEQPRSTAPPRGGRGSPVPDVARTRAPMLYRALGRVSAAAMRKHAGRLIGEARRCAEAERRETLEAHAFELTLAAEELERRGEDESARRTPPSPGPATGGADDPCAPLRARARHWRTRAEEYRTVGEALDTSTARESYFHLARAYDALAERCEAQARLADPAG